MNNNVDELYGMDYVEKFRKQKNSGKMDRLLKLINFHSEDLVLDIGCGPGFLSDKIEGKVKKYTGIDPSIDFIREAKKIHPSKKNIVFFNETAEKHLDRKLQYNKIFLIDVTEHLSDKELTSLIKACSKLLKPDGSIFIHTPNRNYFLEKIREKGFIY